MALPRKNTLLALTFQSVASRSPHYRPDVDGLRAISILCVLLFHAGYSHFAGGFVGVDVFFVISGYLITSAIVNDLDCGRFSFAQFYERRIRRIFPALVVVLLASVVISSVVLSPAYFAQFGKSLLGLGAFASNLVFARDSRASGYFDEPSNMQPLLHTWSLSVEEQFYFVFPIALFVIFKLAESYRTWIITVVALISLIVSIGEVQTEPITAFYVLPVRSWELLIGALLACGSIPLVRQRWVREMLSVAGLGMIAYAVITFNTFTKFPGLNALFPCLGAWLLLYSGKAGQSFVKSLLSLKPLVFIGVISYSLYLWHWPIIVFTKYIRVGGFIGPATRAGMILASLLMGFLSFELVESPFRRPGALLTRRTLFTLALCSNVFFAAFGFLAFTLKGMPQRYSPNKRGIIAINESLKTAWPPEVWNCTNYRRKVIQYSDMTFCELDKSANNILFWGDSHLEMLYPMIEQLRREDAFKGKGAVFALGSGCPPSEHINRSKGAFSCDIVAKFAETRAEQADIDTVVFVFCPWWAEAEDFFCASSDGRCLSTLTGEEISRRVAAEMTARIQRLKSLGKRVLITLPFPTYSLAIPEMLIQKSVFGRFWRGPYPVEISSVKFREVEMKMARDTGIGIYDPRLTLCPKNQCEYQAGGISLYHDGGHMAPSQTGILKQGFLQAFNSVVAP